MSKKDTTLKTLLIVGGLGGAAFIAYKMFFAGGGTPTSGTYGGGSSTGGGMHFNLSPDLFQGNTEAAGGPDEDAITQAADQVANGGASPTSGATTASNPLQAAMEYFGKVAPNVAGTPALQHVFVKQAMHYPITKSQVELAKKYWGNTNPNAPLLHSPIPVQQFRRMTTTPTKGAPISNEVANSYLQSATGLKSLWESMHKGGTAEQTRRGTAAYWHAIHPAGTTKKSGITNVAKYAGTIHGGKPATADEIKAYQDSKRGLDTLWKAYRGMSTPKGASVVPTAGGLARFM